MHQKPRILLAAKRGGNFRHLRKVLLRGELEVLARCRLMTASRMTLPARSANVPLERILRVHLGRRRINRPWLFRHPLVRRIYLWLVRLRATWLYCGWLRTLREWKPDAVVLWNGHRMPESAVKAAAEASGVRVIHVENGCLPNTRTVDPLGVNALNSVPRDPGFHRSRARKADACDWQLLPRVWHRSKSAADIQDSPQLAGEGLPRRFVFVPFQVDDDSQLLLHSPAVRDMRALFDFVDEAVQALRDKELVVIFKEHPTSRFVYPDLHERCRQHPRLRFCNSRDTQELIQKAETVVTINSTVGLEALLFEKRVVTLGNAFYDLPGLIRRARRARELAELLDDKRWQPDGELAHGLIDYLRTEYCVPMNEARNGEDDWQAMATRIVALATAAARADRATVMTGDTASIAGAN